MTTTTTPSSICVFRNPRRLTRTRSPSRSIRTKRTRKPRRGNQRNTPRRGRRKKAGRRRRREERRRKAILSPDRSTLRMSPGLSTDRRPAWSRSFPTKTAAATTKKKGSRGDRSGRSPRREERAKRRRKRRTKNAAILSSDPARGTDPVSPAPPGSDHRRECAGVTRTAVVVRGSRPISPRVRFSAAERASEGWVNRTLTLTHAHPFRT
mmetsp:Transcript_21108/g.50119  ORF Transcript_21108/g.50119 Transcript_21108/m.50119 type:complete len:209 (-) Transcript_21108:423-1049(-)